MDNIVYDESGKLLSGIFYQFDVHTADMVVDSDLDDTWIVSQRNPTSDELALRGKDDWMWVETLFDIEKAKKEHRCPLDKSHITGEEYGPFEVDLFGGSRLSEFLPDANFQIVVSKRFKQVVEKSQLAGMRFVPVKINVNQSSSKVSPELFVLQSQGRKCLRPLKVVGVANACPFCGRKTMICPECGYDEIKCSKCGNIMHILSSVHKGPGDRRLRAAPVPKAGHVLDGSKWDGSDFINNGWTFITKRSLDWLLSVHAAPFYVRPARVWVDRCSAAQLAKIEAAKKPLPMKKCR